MVQLLHLDPLHYAAVTRTKLEGINPILWAIQKGQTINGEDPVLFALQNEGFDVNHDILETADSKRHTITIGNNSYSIGEFKDRVVESIIKMSNCKHA